MAKLRRVILVFLFVLIWATISVIIKSAGIILGFIPTFLLYLPFFYLIVETTRGRFDSKNSKCKVEVIQNNQPDTQDEVSKKQTESQQLHQVVPMQSRKDCKRSTPLIFVLTFVCIILLAVSTILGYQLFISIKQNQTLADKNAELESRASELEQKLIPTTPIRNFIKAADDYVDFLIERAPGFSESIDIDWDGAEMRAKYSDNKTALENIIWALEH